MSNRGSRGAADSGVPGEGTRREQDLTPAKATCGHSTVHPSLAIYLLGAAGGRERDEVEAHLAECVTCQREADVLGVAVEGLILMEQREAAALWAAHEATQGPWRGSATSPVDSTDPAAGTK